MSEDKRLQNEIREISAERKFETVKGCKCGIRVLSGSASSMLYRLWSDVFTDETKRYNDFYFTRKAPKSLCYCLNEIGEKDPVSMMIRTPYSLRLRTEYSREKMKADYIVGVATRDDCRHRGYMDIMLRTALCDMAKEKIPFAFLIPADPVIYTPYGFSYFYFQMKWEKIRDDICSDSSYIEENMDEPTDEWKEFEKKNVRQEYSVYIKRNDRYYQDLFDECSADGGGIVIIRRVDDKDIVGCYSFISDNGKKQITGMTLIPDILEKNKIDAEGLSPFMMGRPADAETMLKMLRCKKKYDHRTVIKFRLSDDIIPQNNSCFECRVSEKKCRVKRISDKDIPKKERERYPMIDVSELACLFGMNGCVSDELQVKNADRLFAFDRCFINELT